MTIKELAYFTDMNKSTVGRWIRKTGKSEIIDKLQNATRDNPADFTIDEVEVILHSSSLSVDAVLIIMANAREQDSLPQSNPVKIPETTEVLMQFLSQMQEQQNKFMAAILNTLGTPEPVMQGVPSLPAPKKADRDKLRQVLNQYAESCMNNQYREAWHVLYEEIYYRLHVNVRVRATNAGISKLDLIERDGLVEEAVAILQELMGE